MLTGGGEGFDPDLEVIESLVNNIKIHFNFNICIIIANIFFLLSVQHLRRPIAYKGVTKIQIKQFPLKNLWHGPEGTGSSLL